MTPLRRIVSWKFSSDTRSITLGLKTAIDDSDMEVCKEYSRHVIVAINAIFPNFIDYSHNGVTVSEERGEVFRASCGSNDGINKCDLVENFSTHSVLAYSNIYKFDSLRELINNYNTLYNSYWAGYSSTPIHLSSIMTMELTKSSLICSTAALDS